MVKPQIFPEPVEIFGKYFTMAIPVSSALSTDWPDWTSCRPAPDWYLPRRPSSRVNSAFKLIDIFLRTSRKYSAISKADSDPARIPFVPFNAATGLSRSGMTGAAGEGRDGGINAIPQRLLSIAFKLTQRLPDLKWNGLMDSLTVNPQRFNGALTQLIRRIRLPAIRPYL